MDDLIGKWDGDIHYYPIEDKAVARVSYPNIKTNHISS